MQYRKLIKHFTALNTSELYEILRVRQEVFVVEQSCAYLDADEKDQHAFHLMFVDNHSRILAYTRLLPEGISYEGYISIGRVLTVEDIRATGAGKAVMQQSLLACEELFGKKYPIKIGAQSYLLNFYQSFGFEIAGAEYIEDGIPHLHMIRRWS